MNAMSIPAQNWSRQVDCNSKFMKARKFIHHQSRKWIHGSRSDRSGSKRPPPNPYNYGRMRVCGRFMVRIGASPDRTGKGGEKAPSLHPGKSWRGFAADWIENGRHGERKRPPRLISDEAQSAPIPWRARPKSTARAFRDPIDPAWPPPPAAPAKNVSRSIRPS